MTVKTGSVERMISRTVAFFGERVERSECRELSHIRALDQIAGEDGGKRYLYIAEMGAPRPGAGVEHDYLVIFMPETGDEIAERGTIIAVAPDTLRISSRETGNSIYMNDIAVALEEKVPGKISILAYAVRRNAATARLLANLQTIAEALAVSADHVKALSLSQAAIDCVETLECSGDAELLIAGSACAPAKNDATENAHFLALVSLKSPAAAETDIWWARGSNLQYGKDAGTARAATGAYMLLRYGPRPTRQSVRRYIEELRRNNALKRDELQSGDAGESYERYVEKEIEKRRQSVIDALYGHHKMLPVVTPLAIEAASDLESYVDTGDNLETPFQRLIEYSRSHFGDAYGVRLPKLRIRINGADMPPGSYLIMINEVPIVMGYVYPGKLFCNGTVEQLKEFGLEADSATNPDDDSEGAWVSIKDDAILRDRGFKAWDPSEYIALHLNSVSRANLSDFFGAQDIADGIRDEDEGQLLKKLRSADGGLSRFKNVIQALLSEELPARPLPLLTKRYLETVGMPAYEIAEELRRLEPINTHLLKDISKWRIFTLGDDFVELMRRNLIFQGDAALLAIEPEQTQDALRVVRNAIGQHTPPSVSVIVVEDWRLRPFIRKLVEIEFPKLKVVAKREVAQVDRSLIQPVTTISLDD